jgi:DNA-binding MarR family transcriptional regulator
MSFYKDVGTMAIGTRLRALSEIVSRDASMIYETYGTNLQPKWFPVFYVLTHRQENTVTSIAESIGHSHASVSKIIKEMSKAGLLSEKIDPLDRRRTQIVLSKKGQNVAQKIEAQYIDVTAAINEISAQTTHNLWAAIEEWEKLLSQKSLHDRVSDKKKKREGTHGR